MENGLWVRADEPHWSTHTVRAVVDRGKATDRCRYLRVREDLLKQSTCYTRRIDCSECRPILQTADVIPMLGESREVREAVAVTTLPKQVRLVDLETVLSSVGLLV